MKTIFGLLLTIISLLTFGQKQGNIWYFGEGLGLDFNNGSPVVLTNGKIDQNALGNAYLSEGSASISDSAGNLLFYSNGEFVWNKDHQVMPNGYGLLGHHSSTQSAFIIPIPQNDSTFYLFTTDGFQNNLANGLRYNKIIMCLDSGRGDIKAGEKNILLIDTVCEKLSATKSNDGLGYWLVSHKYYSNDFYAFLITASGVVNTVVSSTGFVHNSNPAGLPISALGQMKISPDGHKLALAISNHTPPVCELFDFDNATGVVSNPLSLPLNGSMPECYGISFSPNSSKLYVNGAIGLFQFDLLAGNGNPDSIKNSKINIPYSPYSLGGALQLGPDGKIYIIRPPYDYLGVINNPNLKGLACNFTDHTIYLLGKLAKGSLPSFIDSYDYDNTVPGCKHNVDTNISDTIIPEAITHNIFIPNIFTPNGDGQNDVLFVRGNGITSLKFFIYDRWGEKIFETNEITKGWDGMFKGMPMDSGIFCYYLVAKLKDGTTQVKKGNITLIK